MHTTFCYYIQHFIYISYPDPNPNPNPSRDNPNSLLDTIIDGLHLTSQRPCWRYNTKEYVINSIVGSSWRGRLTLSAASREIDCKPRIGIQRSDRVHLFIYSCSSRRSSFEIDSGIQKKLIGRNTRIYE